MLGLILVVSLQVFLFVLSRLCVALLSKIAAIALMMTCLPLPPPRIPDVPISASSGVCKEVSGSIVASCSTCTSYSRLCDAQNVCISNLRAQLELYGWFFWSSTGQLSPDAVEFVLSTANEKSETTEKFGMPTTPAIFAKLDSDSFGGTRNPSGDVFFGGMRTHLGRRRRKRKGRILY